MQSRRVADRASQQHASPAEQSIFIRPADYIIVLRVSAMRFRRDGNPADLALGFVPPPTRACVRIEFYEGANERTYVGTSGRANARSRGRWEEEHLRTMTAPKWRATNFLRKINVLKRNDVEGTSV